MWPTCICPQYFEQVVELLHSAMNVHGVNVVWWTDRHTAEPLMPEPSVFEVEMTTEKLKQYVTLYEILIELIQAGE